MNRTPFSARTLLLGGAAVVVLAGASTGGLAIAGGAFRDASAAPNGQCSAPSLSGTVIDVSLMDMSDGRMMGSSNTGGSMRLVTSTDRATSGTVSFRTINVGALTHELVVLPLPSGQSVGDRVVTGDGRVAETGSLGEVSNTCAAGTGTGLSSGSIGWVTVTLPPGHYELVCNLPGHYAAGMYAELTVG